MQIAFPLYQSFTALDLIGGYQVLSAWPEAEPVLVAATAAPVTDDMGAVTLVPGATFAEVTRPDVVMVPGSADPFGALDAQALVRWLGEVAPTATWMTSVCSGAGLLAAAGLLTGRRASTHWAYREVLAGMGVEVVAERWVMDGNVVTGAGVTAGIDMALALTARHLGEETARHIQLMLEYDPAPPIAGGHLETADPATIEATLALIQKQSATVAQRAPSNM